MILYFTGILRNFSEQSVINCAKNDTDACDGGYWTKAWREIRKNQFIALQSDQPYIGAKDTCDKSTPNGLTDVMNIGRWSIMRKEDAEVKMLGYLKSYGPIAVVINANDTIYYYKRGIVNCCLGGKSRGNHVVAIVGYSEDSLLLKNSWGVAWGEKGYFRLARRCGVLGYSYWASYLSVVDIRKNPAVAAYEEVGEVTKFDLKVRKGKQSMSAHLASSVKPGDIFRFEIPETASLRSNFNIRLTTDDGMIVYLLYVYRTNKGRYCKARTIAKNKKNNFNVSEKCPLTRGRTIIVLIRVTNEGFFTTVGPIQLLFYPHREPFSSIICITQNAGKFITFTSAILVRRVDNIPISLGGQDTGVCFNRIKNCRAIVGNSLSICSESYAEQWLKNNCALTCLYC